MCKRILLHTDLDSAKTAGYAGDRFLVACAILLRDVRQHNADLWRREKASFD